MILLNIKNERNTGFTLLELLIVIAIIAILSIALVFMLNPAETLKKARDAQRISDLKSVKTALGIMLTASSTPSLDGTFGATAPRVCSTQGDGTIVVVGKIAYSTGTAPIVTSNSNIGSDTSATSFATAVAMLGSTAGAVDGTGWIPVKLKALTGGTPISSFPVDPVNTVGGTAAATDLVYRYTCQNASNVAGKPAFVFEIDSVLESQAYKTDELKMAKDGGDNTDMYESGNSLNLLPTTGAF